MHIAALSTILKNLYYIHDQEEFLALFNKALDGHPQYPIEINFYEDGEWDDFKKLLNDFKPINRV